MRFSKKTIFRHGRLEHASRDFHASSPVVRFRIDGEFFFTSLLQFDAPDRLSEELMTLEAGQEVFLGAHALDDGGYWLHWLKAPGVIELVPAPPEEAARVAWDKVAGWGFAMAAALALAIVMLLGGGSGMVVVMGSLLLIGGAICGIFAFDGVGVLLNSASSIGRIMHQGLERLNAALEEGGAWDTPGLGPSTAPQSPPPPTGLPSELTLCQIDHARVNERRIRRPAGRGSVAVDFLVYDFDCAREPVSWLVRDETYSTTSMPAFRRRHPPFLAEGDQVILYCANNSKGLTGLINRYGLPGLDAKPVLELFNLTDGTVYWSETNHSGTLPFLYIGSGLLIAFMLFVLGIMGLFQISEPWFFPAVLSYLGVLAFAACTGILTMGVVILLMELVFKLSDNNPEIAVGRKCWREAVSALRKRSNDSWQDSPRAAQLMQYRIWALLGIMAIAGFCLSLWFFAD